MALPLLAASVVLTGASAAMQYKAARNAAKVDEATASYNAKVDEAQAKQVELDSIQNIRTMRQEGRQFLSKQQADYAAAGVLADSGSPLNTMITNAGRLEQRIQQEHVNSQQRQQELYSAARAGVAAGSARAASDRASGTIALIDGGSRIAGLAFQGFRNGAFGSTGPTLKPIG